MRRLAPRRLSQALEVVAGEAAPAGLLARVQGVWGEVAGPAGAAESEPVAERDGVVTVRCGSAVWAQELELLRADLLSRLDAALGSGGAVRELRFTAAGERARRRP